MGYDCIENPEKANKISSHLVNNWYSAYLISKANKAKFFMILQPFIDFNGTNYKTLFNPPKFKEIKTYDFMYSLIKKKIQEKCKLDKNFCTVFFDGSKWINPNSNYFIDICHLNRNGNEIIVDKLTQLIKEN